jgi:hypothetical protein
MPSARTIKAQKVVVAALKPRNPLVALAAQRKAGSHNKTSKTQRQDHAAQLKRDLAAMGG